MATTKFIYDADYSAGVNAFPHSGAVYDFGDYGRVHVQSAYLGVPHTRAVTITLSNRSRHASSYDLTGLEIGDWGVGGIVLCAGDDMAPAPHPSRPDDFPLTQISDPDVSSDLSDLLTAIAHHYYDWINFRG